MYEAIHGSISTLDFIKITHGGTLGMTRMPVSFVPADDFRVVNCKTSALLRASFSNEEDRSGSRTWHLRLRNNKLK